MSLIYVFVSKIKIGAFSPASVFASIWTCLGLIPMAITNSSMLAYIYVVVAILITLFGAVIGNGLNDSFTYRPVDLSLNHALNKLVLSSISIVSIIGMLLFVNSVGGLSILANISEASREISVTRYGDGLKMPLVSSVAVMLTWVGLVLSFYSYLWTKKSFYFYILFFLFIISMLNGILQTTKLPLLIIVFLLTATYFSYSVQKDEENKTLKRLLVFGPFLLIFLVLVYISFSMLRYGWDEFDSVLLEKFFIYSYGQVFSFAYFMDNFDFNIIALEPWFYIKFFGYFADYSYKQGVYDEYIVIYDGFSSNVFTGFRPLIESFGVIGSLFFCFLCSIFSQYVYRKMKMTSTILCVPVYIYILLSIFMMLFNSPFLFNNITFLIFPFLFLFLLIKRN
ncbi:O-antigen polymerase [Vibrio fluvialis]|uniref:O-antigen polymerase n=1 Tax=Vibrio fluvialis TaxID=676 RepID=UPI00399BD24F